MCLLSYKNTHLVHKSSNWVILINDWHNCSIHLSFMHCPCRQFYSFTTTHGRHSWEVLPFTLSFLVSIVLWKLHVSNMKSICEVLYCIQQFPPIDVARMLLGMITNDATSDFFFNKNAQLPIRVFGGEFSQPAEILRDFEVANLIQILAYFAIVLQKLACADLFSSFVQ